MASAQPLMWQYLMFGLILHPHLWRKHTKNVSSHHRSQGSFTAAT